MRVRSVSVSHPIDGILWVDGRLRSRVEHRQRVPILPQVHFHICRMATRGSHMLEIYDAEV